METIGLQVLLILALTAVGGYFAAAEIALISARRVTLQQSADEGSSGARTALKLIDDPTRLLSTIQICITAMGFLAASAGAVTLAKPLEGWFASLGVGWLASVAPGLAVVIVTLLITYLSLIFGELVPKRLGLQRAERVAIAVAKPVLWLERAFGPVVWLLTASTNVVSRLVGMKSKGGRPGVSEEEIKLLVTEQGSLLDEEKRMIHEIFELGDTVAREIMVPRVDMALAPDTATVGEAAEMMRGTGFSRVPIYHEDRDKIVGVALLKDLVSPLSENGGEASITEHMREAVFVPETKRILPLLSEMRAMHNQMAIVVDEYGGTAGLATMEDIVEEIVGEIADEFDRDHRFIQQVGPGEWVVDGRLAIEEAGERGMPVEESDEYETIAGWMLCRLGHIPVPGERYEHRGFQFRVQTIRRRRIARIRVTAPEDAGAREDDHDA